MKLEGYAALIVLEFFSVNCCKLSIALTRFDQSFVLCWSINCLKSSINCLSTGLTTDVVLFLKVVFVLSKPVD